MDSLSLSAWLMIGIFTVGYVCIIFEHALNINKATVALLMAVLCWIIQFSNPKWGDEGYSLFCEHVSSISQVIFFLLGALTVVEIISVHKGFSIISNAIRIQSKRKMLWVIGFITFFLSAILDNLTTAIVMITLIMKLIDDVQDRLIVGGGVVIAANAGGAWTPIGDVTTTMLWIGGQLSAVEVVRTLFLPSIACVIVSLFILSFQLKGYFPPKPALKLNGNPEPLGNFIFILGISLLICVPILKYFTGLPPFMAMLLALGVLWLTTDIVHSKYADRGHLRVHTVLTRIDLAGTLFFLGILLAVASLESAGILQKLAQFFDQQIGNTVLIATFIGIASAVVDNVPLVAATMGMYDLSIYPTDHRFWQLIAYCAGTGGSILLIGSAAGVVFMGLDKVDFFRYSKKLTIPSLIGYFAGIGVYLLVEGFLRYTG
jgi:Na+/H+ antiporter NhaD/arsenite permease-like protein